jgi:hypothetical protein
VDADALVTDPQFPVPSGRARVRMPQGTRAEAAAVFLPMAIIAWVLCATAASPLGAEAAGLTGILTTIGFITCLVTAAPGPDAVTAGHRRDVTPGRDMDAEARATWARAAAAASALEQSDVVRLGLVDSVRVTTVLPYHLWEIAERLARLSALRAEHQAILRGVDANDPDVATVLAPQRQAQEIANADVERRVRQLEAFAGLAGQADAARRREQAVRRLAALDDPHRELLAEVGQSAGDDGLAEQLSLDVQAVIDQADEAVRQVNEAGRGLVLP